MRIALVALLALLWATPTSAATYYVSHTSNTPAGSDARTCLTSQNISTPRATINAGMACLGAGDTLLIRGMAPGGVYAEAINNVVVAGTSWSEPVRIAAYPLETVWMKPAAGPGWVIALFSGQEYVEFDGINLDTRNATAGAMMGGL